MPATTDAVSTRKIQMSPTQGRTARPASVRIMPAVSIVLRPKREASGTASRPMTAKNSPGIAVIAPAMLPPAPKAASTSERTGPRDAMPARRFTAAMKTAMKVSSTGTPRRAPSRPAGVAVMGWSSPGNA